MTIGMALAALMGASGFQATVPASATPQSAHPIREGASFLREEDYRVARIGYRIGRAGAPYCPDSYPLTGLLLHHLGEYAEADRAEATALHHLDRGPGVLAVIEGSPAAVAGLVAGDVVLAVNDRPLASSPAAATPAPDAARRAIEATERALEQQLRLGPARLRILRDGVERTISLDSLSGCPARVRLARSKQVNAFANRGYAILTTAMLGFIRSDDEIAIILGHEIAHNVLRHPETLEAEGVPTKGFGRRLGANRARVRATEEEADRLGLRLTWAAGYDLSVAMPYWRRLQARFGALPGFLSTHPSLGQREKAIAAFLAEAGAAREEGDSTLPDAHPAPEAERSQ